MKLYFPRTIIALVLLFTLFSCQREIDFPLTEEPVPAGKSYLKSYIVLDTTQPGQTDTIVAAHIAYDAKDRVDSIFTRSYFEGNFDYAILETRFYNGDDTLVTKRLFQGTLDFINIDSTMEFFQYDASHRMIYDSVAELFDPPYDRDVYAYRYENPDKIHLVERTYGLPDTAAYSLITQTRSGGNIISERNAYMPDVSGVDTTYYKTEVAFDSHPNPLKAIEIKWPALKVLEHVYDALFDWEEHQQSNNYTSYSENGFQGLQNAQYTYNQDGYPAVLRYNTDDLYGGIGTVHLKVVYLYY